MGGGGGGGGGEGVYIPEKLGFESNPYDFYLQVRCSTNCAMKPLSWEQVNLSVRLMCSGEIIR